MDAVKCNNNEGLFWNKLVFHFYIYFPRRFCYVHLVSRQREISSALRLISILFLSIVEQMVEVLSVISI